MVNQPILLDYYPTKIETMSYDEESVLRSEIAVNILRKIRKSGEDGTYTKEISEELNSSKSTISHLIRRLRDLKMIKRGKRTKAQYYKINYEGLAEFWIQELEKYLEEDSLEEYLSKDKDVKQLFEENREQIKELTKKYFEKALKGKELEMTLYSFLFTNYAITASEYEQFFNSTEKEPPEWLTALELALTAYSEIPTYEREFHEALIECGLLGAEGNT